MCVMSIFRMACNFQVGAQKLNQCSSFSVDRLKIPVFIMSGRKDGVISNDDVLMHVKAARKAGVDCSHWVFDCSHLEFSMCMADEVKATLLTCI